MHSPKHARLTSSVTSPSAECLRTATIVKLSDKLLLKIFCYYLDVSPRFWPRLVCICRRWQHILFESQRGLPLRLFCIHGMPVLKALYCWPALPVVVQYGGSLALDPPTPEDEDTMIMAALKQSDGVSSISLAVTSSLLERLSTFERPFSELEDLALLFRDSVGSTLLSAFWWSPRLRCLHSTWNAFPAVLQLLYHSRNLSDLQLHEFLKPWHFSPEALTNALSGMVQLQSLSLRFLSATDYLSQPLLSGERVVLPGLTRLDFRGINEYLESLVARIDAPRLGNIEITIANEPIIGVSNLRNFVDRIGMHKSHRRAHIISSERAISISLIQPGAPTCLKLQLICKPLSEQLFSMAQICIHFSALLFHVEDLRICATRPTRREDSLCSGQWPESINSFTGVKWFHVTGNLSTNIVRALQLANRWRETVLLPSLHKLYIPQPGSRPASLSEDVVSFMTSRRLSGHPIAVEYERFCHISELRGTGRFSQQVIIDMLSDDILLNIFCHYLGSTPRFWPTLACVCKRWRQIVSTSPLGLNLRLYCTPGTPVLKALDCWPALPIIVQYGGFTNLDPPAPEDDDNIIAALQQSGRVSSISLTVTSSLLEKLSAILEPLSELEELVLLSRDNLQLALPGAFRWGTRLRTLHLTRIVIPSLLQLLSPSQGLVDLQLHEIPSAGYFSPEAFANALSNMTQLETLSLHFLSLPPRRYLSFFPPTGARIVLPALTCLKYRGTSRYLDSFVARIDAPRLRDIDITFFSQPTMDASELGRFIERIEMQTTLLNQADVQTSEHAISISFTNSSASTTPLRLQISCEQSDWQLSSMARVCAQFSPFLVRVQNLGINTSQSLSWQEAVDGEQWLELIRAFGGTKIFRVAGVRVTDILCALRRADGGHTTDTDSDTTVLPSLRNLVVEEPMAMHGASWDAVQSLITSRSLSGRPVQVDASSYQCHICHASFGWQQGLKSHLGEEHAYRLVCSYCGSFEWLPGPGHLFREHLARKHPQVALAHTGTDSDALISNNVSLSSSYSGSSHGGSTQHHNDLRASDFF